MQEQWEHTLGIKVNESDVDAKMLYCIKKATSMSLSDIQQKVSENEYLLLIDAAELDDLQHLNELKRNLQKMGVAVKLYQDDEEESSEYFDNIEERAIEISEEPFF